MSKKIKISVKPSDDKVLIVVNGQTFMIDAQGRVKTATLDKETEKIESKALRNFLEKLKQNPFPLVRDGLQKFLEKNGLKILENGNFLAYKAVRCDFYDIYSGTIKYNVTETVITDIFDTDPNVACSKGLHVGTKDYARWYGSSNGQYHILLVEVDPRDVVAVPYDDSEKLRCKKLTVRSVIESTCESQTSVVDDRDEKYVETSPDISKLPSVTKIGRYTYKLKKVVTSKPKELLLRKYSKLKHFDFPVKFDILYKSRVDHMIRVIKIGDVYAIYKRMGR